MTDRYSGFVVTLERDLRSDDAQATIDAIRQIKGVIGVEPVVAGYEEAIAETRVLTEVSERLWDALDRMREKRRQG